jgi:hypothetical protein
MASTITLTGDWLVNLGNRNQTFGTGNLGIYATNGIAVTAGQVGLGVIDSLVIDPAGGYVFQYTSGKVKAYRSAAVTPAGTIAVTDGAVTIAGGSAGAANTGLGLVSNDNAGALTKQAATALVIPQATLGIAATTATFTGTATTAAALAEVGNGVDLSGVTFVFRAIGR